MNKIPLLIEKEGYTIKLHPLPNTEDYLEFAVTVSLNCNIRLYANLCECLDTPSIIDLISNEVEIAISDKKENGKRR